MTNFSVSQKTAVVNIELERTPGEVAVSQQTAGAGGIMFSPASPIPAGAAEQTHGVEVVRRATAYQCGSMAVVTSDESGTHHFAKRLDCGKEWCPKCGENDSPTHKQRIARWLPKVQQLESFGYLVIEFPERYRYVPGYTYTKRGLRLASKIIVNTLAGHRKGRRGRVGGYFRRGLLRWHFFGEKREGKYNPHANVIVDGGYIEKEKLESIKTDLRKALNCSDLIVNYSYRQTPAEMYHSLKYITRATFRKYEWNEYMAEQLWNFRNCRPWGKWNGGAVWQLSPAIEAEAEGMQTLSLLAEGICPICGEPLLPWSKPVDTAYLVIWGAVEICPNTGYYVIPQGQYSGWHLSPESLECLSRLERQKHELIAKDEGYWESVLTE